MNARKIIDFTANGEPDDEVIFASGWSSDANGIYPQAVDWRKMYEMKCLHKKRICKNMDRGFDYMRNNLEQTNRDINKTYEDSVKEYRFQMKLYQKETRNLKEKVKSLEEELEYWKGKADDSTHKDELVPDLVEDLHFDTMDDYNKYMDGLDTSPEEEAFKEAYEMKMGIGDNIFHKLESGVIVSKVELKRLKEMEKEALVQHYNYEEQLEINQVDRCYYEQKEKRLRVKVDELLSIKLIMDEQKYKKAYEINKKKLSLALTKINTLKRCSEINEVHFLLKDYSGSGDLIQKRYTEMELKFAKLDKHYCEWMLFLERGGSPDKYEYGLYVKDIDSVLGC